MKKLLIIFSLTFFLQTNSFGITLSKALFEAYKNNPELNAGVTKNTNEAKTDVAFEENKGALSKTDEKTRDNFYVTLPDTKSGVVIDYKVVTAKYREYLNKNYTKDSYTYKLEDITILVSAGSGAVGASFESVSM